MSEFLAGFYLGGALVVFTLCWADEEMWMDCILGAMFWPFLWLYEVVIRRLWRKAVAPAWRSFKARRAG